MAMGGFSGSDPAPTADELAAYVASGELRYVYLVSAGPGGFAPGIGGLPPGALGVPGAPGDAFTPPAGLGGGPSRLGGVGVAAGRLAWVAADCSAVDFGGWGARCTTAPCRPRRPSRRRADENDTWAQAERAIVARIGAGGGG